MAGEDVFPTGPRRATGDLGGRPFEYYTWLDRPYLRDCVSGEIIPLATPEERRNMPPAIVGINTATYAFHRNRWQIGN